MSTSLVKTIVDAFSPVFRPAGNLIERGSARLLGEPSESHSTHAAARRRAPAVGFHAWHQPAVHSPRQRRDQVPQLWNVSNSFDLCRLMIETRKDQVVSRPWGIRVKAQPGETKKASRSQFEKR